MASALNPAEIFERAADEGERRLDQSSLELISTAFIAGFTIIFGIIALGIVDSLARPAMGELAKLLGALAFGFGIVFLVIGRAELFSENFFDPIAAAFRPGRDRMGPRLARLWLMTLLLNLVGGAALIAALSVEGALPSAASESLSRIAEEIVHKSWAATLMRAIVGGALVALLSYLVIACRESVARILVAYMIGVLLALGPFDHGVVSLFHIGFGFAFGADVPAGQAALTGVVTIAGNMIGGIGLVTLSHAAQAKGAEGKTGGANERRGNEAG